MMSRNTIRTLALLTLLPFAVLAFAPSAIAASEPAPERLTEADLRAMLEAIDARSEATYGFGLSGIAAPVTLVDVSGCHATGPLPVKGPSASACYSVSVAPADGGLPEPQAIDVDCDWTGTGIRCCAKWWIFKLCIEIEVDLSDLLG